MKQKKFFMIFAAIMSLVVMSVGGFFVYKTIAGSRDINKTNLEKDEFYSIRNNATTLQKDLYKALLEEVQNEQRDDKTMYELLAQNYVADFYTWTNKFRQNDVGGIQFVHEDIRVGVYHSAQEETYSDLYYYLQNGGLKNTLEVSELEVVASKPIEFFIHDDEGEEEIYDDYLELYVDGDYHDAYLVSLRWTYKDVNNFNVNAYETSANMIMMLNDQGVPMIVEVNYDEEI